MDGLIYLVKQEYGMDEISQQAPAQETLVPVWAALRSVTRADWMDAGQIGLNPQMVAVTPLVNYGGESAVQIGEGENAQRYSIYRTYMPPDSDEIELYLEKRRGYNGAENPFTADGDRNHESFGGVQSGGC